MPSLLRRELGNDHRRSLFHRARKQAIKTPPSQGPTRFSTAPLISTSNWTHIPLSYCQTPRFHGRPEVLFHKVKKASGGVPHYCMAKDQVYSNVRPGPLPSRNFQEKRCIKSRWCATNVPPYAVGKGHPERRKKHRTHAVKRRRTTSCVELIHPF